MCRHAVPAIWLYPERECDADVELEFQGNGFMTVSTPPYQAKWRIQIDPAIPYARYRERYGFQSHHEFLDYDGLREGPYQLTNGWCIRQRDFMAWQRDVLPKCGFSESEIESAVYYYGRMLMDNKYPGDYVTIYPQDTTIVEQSVKLRVAPLPDTVMRMWFYLNFSSVAQKVNKPDIPSFTRRGFVVVEMGFLTRRDVPQLRLRSSNHHLAFGLLPHWVDKTRF